jgi:hypothetical protein
LECERGGDRKEMMKHRGEMISMTSHAGLADKVKRDGDDFEKDEPNLPQGASIVINQSLRRPSSRKEAEGYQPIKNKTEIPKIGKEHKII